MDDTTPSAHDRTTHSTTGALRLLPLFGGILFVVALAFLTAFPQLATTADHHVSLGEVLPLWSGIPFVGILLSIALMPLTIPRIFSDHYGKIAAAWAALFAVPFLVAYRQAAVHSILHTVLLDYVPFMILLWGLYTVGGGIVVRGTLRGTPAVNTAMLFIGVLIASWIGTTGASMVLIRPVLRANALRTAKVHIIVFFIFLVSNIGGALTPLGDPPLFLGFLHGVPFFWTLGLIPHMSFAVIILILGFYAIDRHYYFRESDEVRGLMAESGEDSQPVRLEGLVNLVFLGGIIASVLISGTWHPDVALTTAGIHLPGEDLFRNGCIIAMGILSLRFTPWSLRRDNGFTWHAIQEVAYIFAGIFVTMVPVLAILQAGPHGAMSFVSRAVTGEASYFWMAGALSSFLDNAPTYLTFMTSACGSLGMDDAAMHACLINPGESPLPDYLRAISVGAVFMGANTYIGNAPNFLVRSIAEEHGIPMPSFFGYMLYAALLLGPIYVLLTLIFF